MLESVDELDEIWLQMMNEAAARARASGNADAAAYLSLKATNDFIRQTSIQWLFDSMMQIAAEHNRRASAVLIETENPHRFAFNKANMVGSLLRFRQGVRCLTVEAGWTRTPADGFMRMGALAAARVSHFGIAKENEDIILLKNENAPQWFSVDKHERKNVFDSRHLQKHFQIFTGG